MMVVASLVAVMSTRRDVKVDSGPVPALMTIVAILARVNLLDAAVTCYSRAFCSGERRRLSWHANRSKRHRTCNVGYPSEFHSLAP
jgi:hypothetical protein